MHQVHRLGGAVHRHVDGLAFHRRAALLRGGAFACGGAVAFGCAFRRRLGRFRRGGDLVHRNALLGQAALSPLVEVGLGLVAGAHDVGQAGQQFVGAGQQRVGRCLHVVDRIAYVAVVGTAPGRVLRLAAVGRSRRALLRVAVDAGPQQAGDGRHRLVFALVLQRRQQRLPGRRDGRTVQRRGLFLLDQAAGDAQQHALLVGRRRQRQELRAVADLDAGIPQAARLDARHKGEIVVILRKIGAAVKVKRALAFLGRVPIVDGQHLKAVRRARQVEREAAVVFDDFLLREGGVGIAGALQHGVAGRGLRQRVGGCKARKRGGAAVLPLLRLGARGVDQRAVQAGPTQVAHRAGALLQGVVQVGGGGIVIQRGAVAAGGRPRAEVVAEEPPQRPHPRQDQQQQHGQNQQHAAPAAALAAFDHGQAAVAQALGGVVCRRRGLRFAAARRGCVRLDGGGFFL